MGILDLNNYQNQSMSNVIYRFLSATQLALQQCLTSSIGLQRFHLVPTPRMGMFFGRSGVSLMSENKWDKQLWGD